MAISRVIFVEGLPQGSPASFNPEKKIVFIDKSFFYSLPVPYRVFILFHEYAHALGYESEMMADRVAWNLYSRRGWPKLDGILALSRVLDMDNPEENMRAFLQALRAYKAAGYKVKDLIPKQYKNYV